MIDLVQPSKYSALRFEWLSIVGIGKTVLPTVELPTSLHLHHDLCPSLRKRVSMSSIPH